MRVLAFVLLLATTVCAQANTTLISVGTNASVTPEALGRAMSGVAACSATADAPPFDPLPQTMIMDVYVRKGAFVRVSAMTSSGNPTFDKKAIQCLQNLPADFTKKIGDDVLVYVPVDANNGAVVPDPSVAFIPPRAATPTSVAVQHAPQVPSVASSTAPTPTSPPPGAPPAGAPPGSCAAYYPPLAIRLNQEGETELFFTITTEGAVKDLFVAKSSGYDVLDQAATRCAAQWRYEPAMRNDVPVAVQWHVVIRFMLGGRALSPEVVALQMASQRGLNKLFHDSYACLNAAQIGEDELAKSSHAATGLAVHFSHGVISGVDITHSSGDTTLDGLAVNCFQQKYDAETAQALVHQKDWSVPVVWSIIKPKRS